MEEFSLTTIVVSTACSLLASWLFLKYQRITEKRLKRQIADLDFEIEFLDRIDKGYKELIRVSIKILCFGLGLCILGAVILITTQLIKPLQQFQGIGISVSIAFFLAAALMFFSHFWSLVQLHDKDAVQKKMRIKKVALENKLESR